MEMSAATVLVDSRTLFREGLAYLLHDTKYRPIESVASIAELPQSLSVGPSTLLFIVSINPRRPTTESALARDVLTLRQQYPHARLIVLSGGFNSRCFIAAFEAGANGYILDTMTPDALVESLDVIMRDEMMSPRRDPMTDHRIN
jgi:two-component system, NarL family, nitrate/nitrite response regulator NarL